MAWKKNPASAAVSEYLSFAGRILSQILWE